MEGDHVKTNSFVICSAFTGTGIAACTAYLGWTPVIVLSCTVWTATVVWHIVGSMRSLSRDKSQR